MLNEYTDYNIPRKIRELQYLGLCNVKNIIITYQEKLGNYNAITVYSSRH